MKPNLESMEPRIAEQAAQWLVELEDAGEGPQEEFARWLKQSPLHVQEFLLASAAWREFENFDPMKQVAIHKATSIAEMQQPSPLTLRSARGESVSARQSRGKWAPALAAAVVLVCSIALVFWRMSSNARIASTGTGEQRTLTLPDGSSVQLNTRSRVDVDYTESRREVRLLEGEALFTVNRDSARPFRVRAGETVIRALGTQFNVYRHATGATVSVVEGAVQVSDQGMPARLGAGEQAEVDAGRVIKHTKPDFEKALAWRTKRLVFRGDSLETVVAEFNRYNELHIELESARIRDKRLTGVFDADDPDSLMQFLERDPTVVVERLAKKAVVRGR